MFMIRRIRRVSVAASKPKILADPLLGRRSVVRILMSVVLPAPFGPRRPKNSPGAPSRSTPASATTSAGLAEYTRRRSCVSMAAGNGAAGMVDPGRDSWDRDDKIPCRPGKWKPVGFRVEDGHRTQGLW